METLTSRWNATQLEQTAEYRAWRGVLDDREVFVAVPLTFMNRSGEAVISWRERHGLETADLLVVSDDVYLPAGLLRMRGSGSSGGHRGLESIEGALGTRE